MVREVPIQLMESSHPSLTPEPTYHDLASAIEHLLLLPDLSESDVAAGIELAKSYQVAAVVVRPSDVDLVARWLTGSNVSLSATVDWPFGHSTTSVKTFATRDMLRRGVKGIDTVMNTGKLISRQFQYLEMELVQMADACHQAAALMNVTLESGHLDEELKIVACRICRRAGVDSIATMDLEDIPLLKEYAKERLQLKAAGGIDSLQQALQFREAGCERLQTGNTAAILDAWKNQLAEVNRSPVVC